VNGGEQPGLPSTGDHVARRRFFAGRLRVTPRSIEWALAAFLIGALVYCYFEFRRIGYLPLPFWPDPQDVYADGYSTAWWGFNGAMYNIWKTVYPPLSFVITRLFSIERCYDADVTFARDCDWGLWGVALGFCVINAIIAYVSYRKMVPSVAIPRTIALMLGLPMLYAFEHLNLLVFTYTGLFLAFAPILKSSRARALAMAVAVNLKVYLLSVLLGQLFRKRWRWVETTLILAAAVQLAAFLAIGHGTPLEIYDNIVTFGSDPERASNVNFVMYATTYKSLAGFFEGSFPVMNYIGSRPIEFAVALITVVVTVVQALTLAALFSIWVHPAAVSRTRLAGLCYLLVILSIETGGYTTAGAVFFVFFERFQGAGRIIAVLSAYALCLAVDMNLAPTGYHVVNGYFSGRPVWQDLWIPLGPFVRPGLIILMQIGLITATFQDIYGSARKRAQAPGQDGRPIVAATGS
jgi:hypothetical protein